MSPFFPQATSFFILSLWKDNEIVNSPYVYGLCSAVAQRLGPPSILGNPTKSKRF